MPVCASCQQNPCKCPLKTRRVMKIVALTVAAVAALTLSACKKVDIEKTGSQNVPGASNLYRFCDGTTLIYFTHVEGDNDQYEAFWLGGCTLDKGGKPQPGQGSETTGGDQNDR